MTVLIVSQNKKQVLLLIVKLPSEDKSFHGDYICTKNHKLLLTDELSPVKVV
jgi:hypothetical protein